MQFLFKNVDAHSKTSPPCRYMSVCGRDSMVVFAVAISTCSWQKDIDI